MNGETPTNLSVKGDISITSNNEDPPIKRLNINLESELMTGSLINSSAADITLTTSAGKDHPLRVEELYAADGDSYLKLVGLKNVVNDPELTGIFIPNYNNAVVDCSTNGEGCTEEILEKSSPSCNSDEKGCVSADVVSDELIEEIDDVIDYFEGIWIRIPLDDLSGFAGDFVERDSPLACMANTINNLNKNSNKTAELYNKHPFISSTTKGVTLPSKEGQVYSVVLDSTNFTDYINALNNSTSSESLFACLGLESNAKLDESQTADLFEKLPNVFVEINENNDFSRVYLETEVNEGVTLTIDLSFSYPNSINVTEPVEYTTLEEITKDIDEFFDVPEGLFDAKTVSNQ